MLDPQNVEHFSNFTSVIYSFFVVDKFTSVLHLYMFTLSTLFFKLFKGYSIHLKKKK